MACTPQQHAVSAADRPSGADAVLPQALHRLPLPGVSKHQVILLLHCLYRFARDTWAESLAAQDLHALAGLAHRYAVMDVLELVDSSLLKQCTASPELLTVDTAPAQHRIACDLQLPMYRAHVGQFLGKHADQVDITKVDPAFAAVLRGAIDARAELLQSMIMVRVRKTTRR